jgi:hypothetical protein
MGGSVAQGWNTLKSNVGAGVNTAGQNLAAGNKAFTQNAKNGLANFTSNTMNGWQGGPNPLINGARTLVESGAADHLGSFGQGLKTAYSNGQALENNAVDNLTNNWPTTPSQSSPSSITSSSPIGPYNGAGAGYGQSNSEQNFLNSYQKSLNPNTNYNINAQSNPMTNAPQAGGLKSPGMGTMLAGGK